MSNLDPGAKAVAAESLATGASEQFHAAADIMPGLLFTSRPDGCADFFNERFVEFTGLSREQASGRGWLGVVHPDDVDRVTQTVDEMARTGKPREIKYRIRARQGHYRWFLQRTALMYDAQQQVTAWISFCADVDDLVHAEQSPNDATGGKSEFLATLAHELRNPLAPISHALDLWPRVEHSREEMERLRKLMERQVKEMLRLVDDLLDISRIARGRIQLQTQPVDIAVIVHGALETVQPLLNHSGHQLSVSMPDAPLLVNGDIARLMQVFGNLFKNAARICGQNGSIRVTARREASDAVVCVRDNGVGLSEEVLKTMFDFFTQGAGSRGGLHGGSVIGLTLVKEIVQMHGGSVAAVHTGPGQGSEVIVRLPALPAGDDHAIDQPDTSSAMAPAPLRSYRILVVDDVDASAKTLQMMLRSIGQDVLICHDGPTAIEAARSFIPDVVFLDISMPGMNGYEAARHLRHNPETQHSVLVALTGYGQEEHRRQAVSAGFGHHLVKPTSIDELTHLLTSLPPPPSPPLHRADNAS